MSIVAAVFHASSYSLWCLAFFPTLCATAYTGIPQSVKIQLTLELTEIT